jgi:hypothetical protein
MIKLEDNRLGEHVIGKHVYLLISGKSLTGLLTNNDDADGRDTRFSLVLIDSYSKIRWYIDPDRVDAWSIIDIKIIDVDPNEVERLVA